MKKKNQILTGCLSIVLLSLALSTVLFQFQEAESQQIEKGKNYDKVLLSVNADNSKTFEYKSKPERIFNNGNYFDYLKTEDQDNIKVESMHGSVIYHKDFCSFSFYNTGFIDQGEEKLFGDSIVAKRATINTTDWNNVGQINNELCIESIVEQDGNITIESKKQKANVGYMIYKYVLKNGKWKTELEVFNNSTLNDQKFGFTQTIDLNHDQVRFGNQTINLQNYNGTTFDKVWLDNHKSKLINLLNGHYFDFDLAYDYLTSVTVYAYGDGTSKLVFDYTNNNQILQPQQTLILDPTYGPTAGTDWRTYLATAVNTDCSQGGAGFDGSPTLELQDANNNDRCQGSVGEFDITTIDDGVTSIDSILFEFDTSGTTNGINCAITRMDTSTQPSTRPNNAINSLAVWNEINNSTEYANPDCSSNLTNESVALSAAARTDLLAIVSSGQDWVSYGLRFDPSTRTAGVTRQATPSNMELTVTYTTTPPPNAVEDLVATAISQTRNDLSWSQPNLNGESLLGYQINFTTPCGTPTTVLVNNTGNSTTTASHTGLTLGTCYSYRVSAWTAGGNNATGNIANATTNTYEVPDAPTLSALASSTTSIRFTSIAGADPGDFPVKDYSLRCNVNGGGYSTTVSNSTLPAGRFYEYTGLTEGDTVACQWRDGSAAGWSAWSNEASDTIQLSIIQSQRTPTSNDHLLNFANWIDEMGGFYFGLGLFPLAVMMFGFMATKDTVHIFTLASLFFMGIIHASGYFVYPPWFWAFSLLFGLVIVFSRRRD